MKETVGREEQLPGPVEGSIASADQLEAYFNLPAPQRPLLDAALRGVLAETAVTGLQRYEWRLLQPLLHTAVDSVLEEYTQQDAEVEGPPRPPPPGFDSAEALAARLHGLVDGHDAAPFTLQRLCEVLLEPRRQYSRLDSVVAAVEKLLMVTSTRRPDPSPPPPPALSTLGAVNTNPRSPWMDGRPPQVLDPQQHQALLQQQSQAMGSMQQSLGQQQPGAPQGGLPNGVGSAAAGAHAAPNHAGIGEHGPYGAAGAARAAEATQLEEAAASAFVEAALVDSTGAGGSAGGQGSPAGAATGAAAGGIVPPTPPEQHQASSPPGSATPQGQGEQGDADVACGTAGASQASRAGATPTSMDVDEQAQQTPSPGQQQAAGAALASAAAEQPGDAAAHP